MDLVVHEWMLPSVPDYQSIDRTAFWRKHRWESYSPIIVLLQNSIFAFLALSSFAYLPFLAKWIAFPLFLIVSDRSLNNIAMPQLAIFCNNP
jgi:hypothetical protein